MSGRVGVEQTPDIEALAVRKRRWWHCCGWAEPGHDPDACQCNCHTPDEGWYP